MILAHWSSFRTTLSSERFEDTVWFWTRNKLPLRKTGFPPGDLQPGLSQEFSLLLVVIGLECGQPDHFSGGLVLR